MFARPRASAVRAFTPPALPGFTAKPALIPSPTRFFASLPSTVALAYSVGSRLPRACWPAWLTLSHNVLLDAVCDPGLESRTRPGALLPVACGSREGLSLSHHFISGLTTGFSVLRFTSQPFLNSMVLDSL